jgi:hypothetical protein
MAWRVLIAYTAFVALSGCDEIKKVENKQSDVEKRVQKLEQKLNALEEQLNDITKERGASPISFSGCVIENMKGITSNLAAESVKEACLRKVSVELNINDWPKTTAGYGQIHGYVREQIFGLYVNVTNNSQYTITEMTIEIMDRKTKEKNVYAARLFLSPLPAGTILAGQPPDKTVLMQMPPGTHTFTLKTTEAVNDPNKFFEQYGWDIVSIKGFLN